MPQAPEEPRIFKPGDLFLHGRYEIESFLGEGASGQVYVVRHRFTGDRFALKGSHLADRESAATIAAELAAARASYRIQHRNVVRIFDLACEPDGMVWQIMELLQGQTIGDLLARFGRADRAARGAARRSHRPVDP
jgi:serine/threonine protein kinase